MGTHLRAASRGGGRPGRGEGAAGSPARRGTVLGAQRARAPPAGFQVAQSAGGSRPPGPAPHPAHRSSGAAPSGPPLHSAPLGRSAPGSLPAPGLSVAPRLRQSSQPGEGLVLLAHEGGNPPPFAVPPPSRPPFPGSAAKNGLERQAREFVAPLPRALAPSWGAALGAQGEHPHTWSGPWRRPSVLVSSPSPTPHPGDSTQPEHRLQLQASWGQNRAGEPLETSVSPSGTWKVTRNRLNGACGPGHALLFSESTLHSIFPVQRKCEAITSREPR